MSLESIAHGLYMKPIHLKPKLQVYTHTKQANTHKHVPPYSLNVKRNKDQCSELGLMV